MFKKVVSIILLATLGLSIGYKTNFVNQVKAKAKEQKIKDHYIVVLEDKEKGVPEVAEQMRKAYGLTVKGIYKEAVKGYFAYISPDKIEKVRNDPRVKYVSADKAVSISPKPDNPGGGKPDKPDKPNNDKPKPRPQIQILNPNGGETLQIGETYRISWEASSDIYKITLFLATDAHHMNYIATDLPNTGYYDWQVDKWNTTETEFLIKALGYSKKGTAEDFSDNHFTILDPTPSPEPLYIEVTDPNGGETLTVGQTYRILWDSSTNIDKVNIGYKSCPSCLDWIAFNIPNENYHDWEVDVGSTTNTQFKIDITGYDTGVGSVTDQSDDYFTVLQPPTPSPSPSPSPSPTPEPLQVVPTGVSRIGLSPTNTGSGVNIAVLDTGIDLDHPDLAENVIANVNCLSGTCITGGNDDNGHGTHVAGTIAALDNEIGVIGVAPEAKVIAVKVLDNNGHGTFSSVIAGIDWSLANAGNYNIKVANMSLGGQGKSDNACGQIDGDPLHEAICNATAAGITFVVSAGNSEDDVVNYIPANYNDTVITVSALTDTDGQPGGLGGPDPIYRYLDDTFATFSNYGDEVDLGAPGIYIYSTYLNGSYVYANGTSMAAPHVAGTAALYLESNPGSNWNTVRDALINVGEPSGSGHTDPSGLHPEPVVKANNL